MPDDLGMRLIQTSGTTVRTVNEIINRYESTFPTVEYRFIPSPYSNFRSIFPLIYCNSRIRPTASTTMTIDTALPKPYL